MKTKTILERFEKELAKERKHFFETQHNPNNIADAVHVALIAVHESLKNALKDPPKK